MLEKWEAAVGKRRPAGVKARPSAAPLRLRLAAHPPPLAGEALQAAAAQKAHGMMQALPPAGGVSEAPRRTAPV